MSTESMLTCAGQAHRSAGGHNSRQAIAHLLLQIKGKAPTDQGRKPPETLGQMSQFEARCWNTAFIKGTLMRLHADVSNAAACKLRHAFKLASRRPSTKIPGA